MPKKNLHFHEHMAILVSCNEIHNNLMYVSDWKTFFLYENGHYIKLERDSFKRKIDPLIKRELEDISVDDRLLDRVYDYMKTICTRRVSEVKTPYIAFSNQLFNTETCKFEKFDREKIAIHFFDFPLKNFDYEEAKMPMFINFLKTTLVEEDGETPDIELMHLAQQMFGYYLTNNLKGRITFFLWGGGYNGKSKLCDLIIKIIGEKFCTSMTLEQLTMRPFSTAQLVSKKLNVCNEESSKFIKDAMFKSLISGEPISAERKNQDSFTFRPQTKFLFATNELPTFSSTSRAMLDRIIILPFYADFNDPKKQMAKRDIDLFDKLLPEIPEIVKWSLQGMKDLVNNKYRFTEATACINCLSNYKRENSSAIAFLDDNYEFNINNYVINADLYGFYQNWCAVNGRKPLNSANFYREICGHKGIKPERIRHEGKLVRAYYISRLDEAEISASDGTVDPDVHIESKQSDLKI